MKNTNRLVGEMGEELALAYLLKRGYRLIEKNYRSRAGEIDIVMHFNGLICFVEVKTSTSEQFGEPWERVGRAKLVRLIRLAEEYLAKLGQTKQSARIDVVSVTITDRGSNEIELFENVTGF